MLKLNSNSIRALSPVVRSEPGVYRLSEGSAPTPGFEDREMFIARKPGSPLSPGFVGYTFFANPAAELPANSFLFEKDLSYLKAGDIIKLSPKQSSLRVLYRRNSPNNFFLTTERCNNYCLMCSQPPKDRDDSYIVQDILAAIPLMSPETKSIGLTGGEPTLLGVDLIKIVENLKTSLPSTAVHILSNGRAFKAWDYSQRIAQVQHPDLMIGIPLYSDISSLHDYIVQADGAFDDTIRGIINLKSVGVQVEIRVVLHKLTYERLPDLARFIRRNLTFCDHVALMGLEITGFTKFNFDRLWIDPKDYQGQLVQAVLALHRAHIPVSIYNHQLCVIDQRIMSFSRKSISDWKNNYLPKCDPCMRKNDCGGFFSTSGERYSSHIRPFVTA